MDTRLKYEHTVLGTVHGVQVSRDTIEEYKTPRASHVRLVASLREVRYETYWITRSSTQDLGVAHTRDDETDRHENPKN